MKRVFFVISIVFSIVVATSATSQTVSAAFQQALSASAAADKDVAAFYKARGYSPLWTTGTGVNKKRTDAFVRALSSADAHGLPSKKYNANAVASMINAARTDADLGKLDATLSRLFLNYARDIQTGVTVPSKIDSEIVRKVPYRGRQATLVAFSRSDPSRFMNALPPKTPEYARLMQEKLRYEKLIAAGGWGPKISARSLKPGDVGSDVLALSNRLTAMGFMTPTTDIVYDDTVTAAVQQFQLAHGLSTDGVAGAGTMRDINRDPAERLASIIVAMERERWINRPRGERHIWVNLTDFSAKIIDNQKVTFETRSVVGKNEKDRRSPEFSDIMEFMVINPSWYVPRSITVKEYLPLLQTDKNAVSHLELRDQQGKALSRSSVDFASYDEETFPYSLRDPPSQGNALGLVKFMFPNKYNIYLHDTPAKSLFGRETRAFSHGCIRLNDPFDFAYALLAKQTSDPVGFFKSQLNSGVESRVNLQNAVPVHIVYRTAFTKADGRTQFRRDVYGRDAKIWRALRAEGVVLRAVQG